MSNESVRCLSAKLERSLSHRVPNTTLLDRQGRSCAQRIELLREAAKDFAAALENLTPVSREQSLAITNLEQALMWAIKGIVLEGPP